MALLVCAGCAKRRSANIVSHPEWQYESYRRIAVLPFQVPADKPEAAEAARQAEFYFVDLLTQSGAFHVATRSDLAAVMTEQDLARLAGVSDPGTAMPEGMVEVAQALVIGRITQYDLAREQHERRVPRYAKDRRGRVIRDRAGRPVVVGEDVYTEYRHIARLAGNVRVIDAATGHVLVSYTTQPIEKDDSQWNSPPGSSPEDLAEDVALEVAAALNKAVAPIEVSVKLDGDCLIVATGYYEGRYEETSKVPTNVAEILLVARDLPKPCDRNDFRLAISPKDGTEYLVEHEFTWSPSLGKRGVAVAVPVADLVAAGGEKFVAKLFSIGNEAPIIEREFKLVEPEE
jgi:hypothetical protein